MSAKFIFAVLSALLLMQCTFARSVAKFKQDSSEESSEKDVTTDLSYENLSERTKLSVFAITEFSKLANANLQAGMKLLKEVVGDIATEGHEANPIMREKNGDLYDVIHKIEKIVPRTTEQPMERFDLMMELDDLLHKFDTKTHEKPSSENLFIENSLKKHGLESMEHELREKFLAFTEKFNHAADKYWNSLSEQEKRGKKEFSDWYKQFQEETDVERKIASFGKFFQII